MVTLFSVGALLSFPSASSGSAAQFLPRIFAIGGQLDISMKHERNVNVTPTGGIRTSDTVLQEKLRLFGAGYIYHPRFIFFKGFLGGALEHEKFESSSTGSNPSWKFSTSDEYGLSVKVLPQHPYSLEMYTERRTPLVERRLSSSYRPAYYDRGVIFRYKKRVSSLTLSYIENIVDYGTFKVNSVAQAADGTYAIGPFMNAAGHKVTDSVSSSTQTKTTQIFSYFDNTLSFKKASFTSHIDVKRLAQDNPLSGSFHNDDALSWKEQAHLALPWNFRTSGGYHLNEETITERQANAVSERTFSREIETVNFTVSHRLYNSLATSYYVNNSASRSTFGDMKTKTEALSASYDKLIPWGRFIAMTFAQTSLNDIKNAPTIPDEVHTITVTELGLCDPNVKVGCFDLGNQSVDINSIIVRVKSKTSDEIISLTSADYTVDQIGLAVRITIKPLALISLGFILPDTLDFHVSYSFIQQMVEYKTTNMGYNVKFELFNNLINPYFAYSKSDQEVLSGTLPGGPQHVSAETVGVTVMKRPYSFSAEFQSIRSNINPSRIFRSTAAYQKNIAPDTSLNARIYYTAVSRHATVASSDNTLGAEARLQKHVPRKNLSLGIGISSVRRQASSTTSETSSVDSSLTWRIGKLSLGLSASLTESVSTTAGVKNATVFEQYYLTLSRRLF
jgi:hypothetical protein